MTMPSAHWVLQRLSGLGDVCMALCACKGIKSQDSAATVWLLTAPNHAPIAARCPFVDEVFTSPRTMEEALREVAWRGQRTVVRLLDNVRFGLDPFHQVEAFLMGLDHPRLGAGCKSLDLRLPDVPPELFQGLNDPRQEKRRIVFHAAKGDPNRTWPQEHWEELGRRVLDEGHQLILVGDGKSDPVKGVQRLGLTGAIDWVDRLKPLDLVALLRASDVLVSTDSGPIQLAGASDVAICGIYTTVAGRCRMPFRHGQPLWGSTLLEPECSHRGCLRRVSESPYAEMHAKTLRKGGEDLDKLFATWCVEEDRFHCLRELTPERAWMGLEPWLQVTPRERAGLLGDLRKLAQSGAITEALERLETLPEVPSDLDGLLLQARLLQELGRHSEASLSLKQVLTQWPMHGEALNLMGLGSLREGQSKAARVFFDLAIGLPETQPSTRRNLCYLDALEALERGDADASEPILKGLEGEDALMDSVTRAEVAVLRLGALLMQNRLGQARILSDQAVQHGWEHPDLHYLRGELMLQFGSVEEAVGCFQACLSRDPSHANAAERLSALA